MDKISRTINLARRAEIGAERRSRTRALILAAGYDLLGSESGRSARIDDICAAARVARGTFYYYFPSMEAFLESLSSELKKSYGEAVHRALVDLEGPLERTGASTRYYLAATVHDSRWGWALVNSGIGRPLFGQEVSDAVTRTIEEGMDAGVFNLPSAKVGRDLLLGASLAAMISILSEGQGAGFPEIIARHVLMSLGVDPALAAEVVSRPLPALDTTDLDPSFLPAAPPS